MKRVCVCVCDALVWWWASTSWSSLSSSCCWCCDVVGADRQRGMTTVSSNTHSTTIVSDALPHVAVITSSALYNNHVGYTLSFTQIRRRQKLISTNNQQQQSLPTFTSPPKKTQKHWILSEVKDIYINCLKLNLTYFRSPFLTDLFFSYV